MPPPVVRPTLSTVARASIVDEKKRPEKVAAQTGRVYGAAVFRIDATQHNNTLQKEKGDNKKEDKRKSGEVGRHAVVRTAITNESTNRMVCKGNEYTPALENSNDEENVQDGNEQPCQGNVTIEDLAKAEKKRLEQETDQTIERLMRKHNQEVDKMKNDLQRQHRKEIDEITNALNSKHDKEFAKMRKELQDMKIKKELAENELEKAKKTLNGAEKEVHHVMNAAVNQKSTVKFTGRDKPLQRAPVMLPSDNLLFYQNRLLSRPAPDFIKYEMADALRNLSYSEPEDEDKEGGEIQTKDLDQKDAEMPRLTPENSENRQKTKYAEVLKHVDKATAMFKQAKIAESVNAASLSKQKDENLYETQIITENAEAALARTMDRSTKSVEYANAVSAPVSKQKHEIPNEKSVMDKTVKTTAGMKSTVTGKTSSGEKPTRESNQRSDNLSFYQNILLSRPTPGFTIETILRHKGDYKFFDDYPGFIHWLFPVPESTCRNAEAQPLYEHEAKKIRDDDELSSRVLEAFKVMLNFYGMRLSDDVKGKFKRIAKTYEERYEYLQRNTVNYMRITRILMSIGELGLDRFQCPWIDFLISEGIDNAKFLTLDGQSIQHWISAVKDEGEKHAMFRKYQRLAGHKALIAYTEEDMEISNDVYSAPNTEYNTCNADVDYARAEGS